MFPFLAFCLSSEDASLEVIDLAIETLLIFAENDSNANEMKRTFGVFESVELIASRNDMPENLKTKAMQLMQKRDCKEYPAHCTRSRTRTQEENMKKRRANKMIMLHIHGLNNDNEKEVSSVAVQVPGVVSVVLNVLHQRCNALCYKEAKAVDIAEAIYDEVGLTTQLVNKNRYGQEYLVPLLETDNDDSLSSLPPYLKEDDSPVKDKAVSSVFLIKDKTASWLNSTVEFLQKSFYW
ncbi:armadillo repeat-containing protein 1-like isoform X2 [Macrosteles quadrilineatus]|nr:armadillo repeat-containing protein 1-like isoform X2 [Macrosteles quadrilineatus]